MGAHPFQTNFTAGEQTEQLLARVDWEKYANGAACLKNFLVRPHGGAASRAGTMFISATKDPTARVFLKGFIFSVLQPYMLEFGPGYIRFYANRGRVEIAGVPVEVATPYTQDELRELRFEQSADVLYIAHRAHPPAKLQRLAADQFRYQVINFRPPPTFEQEITPVADLSLTATSGTGQSANTSAAAFLAGDVGRQIKSGPGRGVITSVGGATGVALDILDDFTTTGPIPAGEWTMDGTANAGTLTTTGTAPVNAGVALTASLAAFRTDDVNAYIYMNNGIVRITEVVSDTVVNGVIVKAMTETDPPDLVAEAGGWTLERPIWTALLGFPGVVALHDQRLWFAGSDQKPDGFWGSVVGDYENFAAGSDDADSVAFVVAAPGVNMIRWMKGLSDGIGLGTLANELLATGGTDAPISPSAITVKDQTTFGTDYTVDAIRISNVVVFLQRGALRVREFTFDFVNVNAYVAPDLAIIAEHLLRVGVVEMAYASSPDSILFCVRPDGVLLTLTYERAEKVVGWAHHDTQGLYESVAVIPNNCGTGDEVWVAVRRAVLSGAYWAAGYWGDGFWADGYWAEDAEVERRGIEIFDGAANTDAAAFYSGVAAGTFSGLDHLEGQTVKVIAADGTVYDLVVVGGQVSLPTGVTTTAVEIGLHYTATIQTLRPELATGAGTAQGRKKHWNHVTVRVACTHGVITLNGEPIEYPEEVASLIGPTTPYTGDMFRKVNLGWDREGQHIVQRTEPKPVTVLGITGSIQIEDP
jgi:hypothetical protein